MAADLRSPWQQLRYSERERIAETLIALNNRACAAEDVLEASHHAELVKALVLIADNAKIGLQVQEQCVDEHDALNEANATLHQIVIDVDVMLAKIGGDQ